MMFKIFSRQLKKISNILKKKLVTFKKKISNIYSIDLVLPKTTNLQIVQPVKSYIANYKWS